MRKALLIYFIIIFSSCYFNCAGQCEEEIKKEYYPKGVLKEAIYFKRDNNLWMMDINENTQKQLTRAGIEGYSVSKSGDKVAYACKGNVYLLLLKESQCIKISECCNTVLNFRPTAISPDGEKIAFVVPTTFLSVSDVSRISGTSPPPPAVKEGAVKQTEILIYYITSKKVITLVKELPPYLIHKNYTDIDYTIWQDDSLFWSRDSNQLHFRRDFIPYDEKSGPRSAYIVNLENKKIQYIKEQEQISDWFGQKILYASEGGNYIYSTSSGVTQNLRGQCFAFTSDWTMGAYTQYNNNQTSINIRNNRGENKTVLNLGNQKIGELAWNRNGDTIIFTKYLHVLDKFSPQIWIVNADGKHLKKIADDAMTPFYVMTSSQ